MDTDALLNRHLQNFGSGNLDALMAEYDEEAIFLTAQGVLRGPAQIRPLVEAVVAEFSLPGVTFELLSRQVAGDHAYLSWRAETPKNAYLLGSDTMTFRDGRIVMQTAAVAATPKG
jgi:ketosteroid isomerase-like protein